LLRLASLQTQVDERYKNSYRTQKLADAPEFLNRHRVNLYSLSNAAVQRRRASVGWIRLLGINPRYQRELLRMPDGFHGKIDVQVWPVEMVGRRPLHVCDGTDCGVAEPGKVRERYKKLFISKQDPKAVR
jgi:hypothetical protein